MSNIVLHVIADFASYVRGEIVRDAEAIASILETNPHHVVKVAAPAATTDAETTNASADTAPSDGAE